MMLKITTLVALLLGTALATRDQHDTAKSLRKKLITSDKSGHQIGIYNGESTTIEDHPYMVGVLIGGSFHCAGVIVSESWVLTVATCVYKAKKAKISVVAGSNDGISGTSYKLKKKLINSNYYYGVLDYNYALLKIQGTFDWSDTVANVTLPSQDPTKNMALTVVGFGETDSDSSTSTTLNQGTMKWYNKTACATLYADYYIDFTDRMGCAYNKGKTTVCAGDVGASFLKDDVLYALAIGCASEGFCSESAYPTIVADIYAAVSWIQDETGASVKQLV